MARLVELVEEQSEATERETVDVGLVVRKSTAAPPNGSTKPRKRR